MDTILTTIKLAISTVFLLLIAPSLISADRDSVSANVLSKYWNDARDVLEDLDSYQALWIKIHGCV